MVRMTDEARYELMIASELFTFLEARSREHIPTRGSPAQKPRQL